MKKLPLVPQLTIVETLRHKLKKDLLKSCIKMYLLPHLSGEADTQRRAGKSGNTDIVFIHLRPYPGEIKEQLSAHV